MAFEGRPEGNDEDDEDAVIGCEVALAFCSAGEVGPGRGCEGSVLGGMADTFSL